VSQSLETVAINRLKVKPQVRKHFDDASLDGLAANIREVGLQQPLIVRREDDSLVVLDGERRLRAFSRLGATEVPVLILDDDPSIVDVRLRQLACNLQREDLTPIDRAEAIRQLMDAGSMTADQVAKRLGQSPATVSRTLTVLKLPEDLRAKVASGQIPADAAYLLARIDEPQRQSELAAEVVGGKLSRDALTRKMKRVRRAEAQAKDGPNRITALLGGGRSITVGGKGLTLDSLMEALEQLLSRARKSKSQGLTLTTFVRTLRDQAAS